MMTTITNRCLSSTKTMQPYAQDVDLGQVASMNAVTVSIDPNGHLKQVGKGYFYPHTYNLLQDLLKYSLAGGVFSWATFRGNWRNRPNVIGVQGASIDFDKLTNADVSAILDHPLTRQYECFYYFTTSDDPNGIRRMRLCFPFDSIVTGDKALTYGKSLARVFADFNPDSCSGNPENQWYGTTNTGAVLNAGGTRLSVDALEALVKAYPEPTENHYTIPIAPINTSTGLLAHQQIFASTNSYGGNRHPLAVQSMVFARSHGATHNELITIGIEAFKASPPSGHRPQTQESILKEISDIAEWTMRKISPNTEWNTYTAKPHGVASNVLNALSVRDNRWNTVTRLYTACIIKEVQDASIETMAHATGFHVDTIRRALSSESGYELFTGDRGYGGTFSPVSVARAQEIAGVTKLSGVAVTDVETCKNPKLFRQAMLAVYVERGHASGVNYTAKVFKVHRATLWRDCVRLGIHKQRTIYRTELRNEDDIQAYAHVFDKPNAFLESHMRKSPPHMDYARALIDNGDVVYLNMHGRSVLHFGGKRQDVILDFSNVIKGKYFSLQHGTDKVLFVDKHTPNITITPASAGISATQKRDMPSDKQHQNSTKTAPKIDGLTAWRQSTRCNPFVRNGYVTLESIALEEKPQSTSDKSPHAQAIDLIQRLFAQGHIRQSQRRAIRDDLLSKHRANDTLALWLLSAKPNEIRARYAMGVVSSKTSSIASKG